MAIHLAIDSGPARGRRRLFPWGAWTILPAGLALEYNYFWWTYLRQASNGAQGDGASHAVLAEHMAKSHILATVTTATRIAEILALVLPLVLWWTRKSLWWAAPLTAALSILIIRVLTVNDVRTIGW